MVTCSQHHGLYYLPPFSLRNKLLVTGFHRVSHPSSYLKEEQEQVRNTEIVGE